MNKCLEGTRIHTIRFIIRLILFVFIIIGYMTNNSNIFFQLNPITIAVWLMFMLEMLGRLFPNKYEVIGCQKQFAVNYVPIHTHLKEKPFLQSSIRTFISAALWIGFHVFVGVAYYMHIIDEGILVILCSLYSICDMICVLFFCPFQLYIMKNRCCTVCRIYNWDYAMMFTPFLFIRSFYTWSLLAVGIIILIQWEIAVKKHPERFSKKTNQSLSCVNCTEKLCKRKYKLQPRK